jgi:hypothetical protein
VQLGAEFQYSFDLGDEWVHRCTVGDEKVDPFEVLGIRPAAPMAYSGWGHLTGPSNPTHVPTAADPVGPLCGRTYEIRSNRCAAGLRLPLSRVA